MEQIQIKVKNTLDNTIYRIENNVFSVDEICVRLHHELVWIHPFPNGNGRFSRIISDELRLSLSGKPFVWGVGDNSLVVASENRNKYISALRLADKKDYMALINFAVGKPS